MRVKQDDDNLTNSEQQDAIDCWVHGIAHLIDAFGRHRTTSLMVCATGYLIEENDPDEDTNHQGDNRSC